MRKLLSNKLYLMLISVLIAFVMWVSVVSISNPDTTGSKAVTVEERNASAITLAGKAYTIQGSKTVKVNYTVQARDAYKVKSSDFRAYVDLSDIYDATGSVRIVVQAVNNQDIISECSCTPQTLQVIVEDVITKTVDVKLYTVDNCPAGYEAAASATALTQVDITGPESLINGIAVAGVEVSVKDATGTLSGNAPLRFYDSDDASARAVDVENNQFFKASANSTDYTLFINAIKTVPIQYEISGTPAAGYHYTTSTASVESVEIKGSTDLVGQISAITIPSSVLNVDGATSRKSWNIDLDSYLPAGVSTTGVHQTEVTALIEADAASGGPGVAVQTEGVTTANQTESTNGGSTAESSSADQTAGGPGVDTTKAETETVPEKQAETQSGTQEETTAGTSAGAHSQTEGSSESQSHEQSSAHTESQSGSHSESQSESQAQTQEQSGSQHEGQSQAEVQSEGTDEVQAESTAHEQVQGQN